MRNLVYLLLPVGLGRGQNTLYGTDQVVGDAERRGALEVGEQQHREQSLGAGVALERFGPLARTVLEHWGIHATEDLGDIVFALVEDKVIRARWRIATDPRRTADQYAVWLHQLLALEGFDKGDVEAAIDAAATAFEGWRDATPAERQRALLRLADMIEAQRNYTANSKVFQTGSDLMDVLVNLKR